MNEIKEWVQDHPILVIIAGIILLLLLIRFGIVGRMRCWFASLSIPTTGGWRTFWKWSGITLVVALITFFWGTALFAFVVSLFNEYQPTTIGWIVFGLVGLILVIYVLHLLRSVVSRNPRPIRARGSGIGGAIAAVLVIAAIVGGAWILIDKLNGFSWGTRTSSGATTVTSSNMPHPPIMTNRLSTDSWIPVTMPDWESVRFTTEDGKPPRIRINGFPDIVTTETPIQNYRVPPHLLRNNTFYFISDGDYTSTISFRYVR